MKNDRKEYQRLYQRQLRKDLKEALILSDADGNKYRCKQRHCIDNQETLSLVDENGKRYLFLEQHCQKIEAGN